MGKIPEEVYLLNMKGVKQGVPSYKSCRHRPWYRWWTKPHYRTLHKLTRKDKVALRCQSLNLAEERTEDLSSEIQPSRSLVTEHSNKDGTVKATDADNVAPMRRVRIAEEPEHIIDTSAESGIESAFTSTPSGTRRADELQQELVDEDAEAAHRRSRDLQALLDRNPFQNRDSYISMEYHSAASSLSDGYCPSVATASQKSVYFSVTSDKDPLVEAWLPDGEVRN